MIILTFSIKSVEIKYVRIKFIIQDWIKVVEQEDMVLTSSHKHIKNGSSCGTILTENSSSDWKNSYTNIDARKIST